MGVHDRPKDWGKMTPEQKQQWAAQQEGKPQQQQQQQARPQARQPAGGQQPQKPTTSVNSMGQDNGGASVFNDEGNYGQQQPADLGAVEPQQANEMAQQVDARGILARVLRAIADGFEYGN